MKSVKYRWMGTSPRGAGNSREAGNSQGAGNSHRGVGNLGQGKN